MMAVTLIIVGENAKIIIDIISSTIVFAKENSLHISSYVLE